MDSIKTPVTGQKTDDSMYLSGHEQISPAKIMWVIVYEINLPAVAVIQERTNFLGTKPC